MFYHTIYNGHKEDLVSMTKTFLFTNIKLKIKILVDGFYIGNIIEWPIIIPISVVIYFVLYKMYVI